MATTIQIKRSSTASAVPLAGDLEVGELAVNLADKRLFTKKSDGTVVELSTNPTDIDIATLRIDGVEVTASAAELNSLDGSTATTADLNKLAAVTATSTELNVLDGFTGSTAELNFVDGVTSNIQTQLDNKQPLDAQLTDIAGLTPTDGTFIVGNGTNFVAESGDTAIASLGITATATELNTLDGITATTTELNHTDGVTSNIQTQLDAMVEKAGDTMTGDLSMGDNVKAKFGASDDLQIYHDGTTSLIKDSGTGNLTFTASSEVTIENPARSQYMLRAADGGAVTAYHNGSAKLATTATGVDVTGTVTADGLTVDGTIDASVGGSSFDMNDANGYPRFSQASGSAQLGLFRTATNAGGGYIGADETNCLDVRDGTSLQTKMVVSQSGNVGIGTASPSVPLQIQGDGNTLRLDGTANTSRGILLRNAGTSTAYLKTDGNLDINCEDSGRHIAFKTADSERLRIDSSGNVGIGTVPKTWQSQSNALEIGEFSIEDYEVSGSNATNILFNGYRDTDNSFKRKVDGYSVRVGSYLGDFAVQLYGTGVADEVLTGSPAMRIDSSGNLLVGTTDVDLGYTAGDTGFVVLPDGTTQCARDSQYATFYVQKLNNDGDLIELNKDGSGVGSIGTRYGATYIAGDGSGVLFNSNGTIPTDGSGIAQDNVRDLGQSTARWDDVYATNGTIQTSDRNEKQDIETLSDAEQRVAVACKGLLRKFRWKDAVEEKGDKARIHFGIIAQDLKDAFEAEGLDAGRYAMFISSTWTDEETGEERTRLGVRYPELLAFIIASI